MYVLVNSNIADPILQDEQNGIVFKALKESLMNPSALGHPNYQIPFFLFAYEKEENALRVLSQKPGDHL